MNPITEIAVSMTNQAARAVAENLKAMPPERQTWSPLDAGRSALSIVQECAVMNRFFAEAIRDRRARDWTWEWYHAECAALETPEKAVAALEASAAELTTAMQSVPDDQLQAEVVLPFGPGMQVTIQQMLFFPYWNMTYHQGQLAYIQTLYGDREMHGMG